MFRTTVLLLLFVVGIIFFLDAVKAEEKKELTATVKLIPHDLDKRNVTGFLKLLQTVPNGPVKIIGKVYNLTEGLHGFHVHEKGDLSNMCTSAGSHFNPDNTNHGAPEDKIRHAGDLGNLKAGSDGVAVIDMTDTIISLGGANSIIGRSFVVHSGPDDLGKGNHTLSLSTGNSGDRVACGIVGVSDDHPVIGDKAIRHNL